MLTSLGFFYFLPNFGLYLNLFQIHIEDGQELWGAGSTFSEQEILTQLYFNYYANLHLVSVVWGLVYLNVNYLLFILSVNNPLKLIALFALSSYYVLSARLLPALIALQCIVGTTTLHCNRLWDWVLKSAKHLRLHWDCYFCDPSLR